VYRSPGTNDCYGIFYLALSATPSFENYYASVAELTPCLREPAWLNSCNGFYVSCIEHGLPRISYFAFSAKKATEAIESICRSSPLAHAKSAEPLKAVSYVDGYGGTESAFRRYLCDYTQVGLDLLEADRLEAQRLCATYRLSVHPSGASARGYLEPSFDKMSAAYGQFSAAHKDVFWTAFGVNEGSPKTPWDHMLVNQILGCDIFASRPHSNDEINDVLSSAGREFAVPTDWAPACGVSA
jgi:hypothetical protein